MACCANSSFTVSLIMLEYAQGDNRGSQSLDLYFSFRFVFILILFDVRILNGEMFGMYSCEIFFIFFKLFLFIVCSLKRHSCNNL